MGIARVETLSAMKGEAITGLWCS